MAGEALQKSATTSSEDEENVFLILRIKRRYAAGFLFVSLRRDLLYGNCYHTPWAAENIDMLALVIMLWFWFSKSLPVCETSQKRGCPTRRGFGEARGSEVGSGKDRGNIWQGSRECTVGMQVRLDINGRMQQLRQIASGNGAYSLETSLHGLARTQEQRV